MGKKGPCSHVAGVGGGVTAEIRELAKRYSDVNWEYVCEELEKNRLYGVALES